MKVRLSGDDDVEQGYQPAEAENLAQPPPQPQQVDTAADEVFGVRRKCKDVSNSCKMLRHCFFFNNTV